MRAAAAILAVIFALAVPAVATAATPAAASKQIARCLRHDAGALQVVDHGRGGRAYFARPFDATSVHYLEWHPFYVDGRGQLRATMTVSAGLTRGAQRHAVNVCLRPYNGHV
jgi:hypothetical protein